jgi:hypothetical protein
MLALLKDNHTPENIANIQNMQQQKNMPLQSHAQAPVFYFLYPTLILSSGHEE